MRGLLFVLVTLMVVTGCVVVPSGKPPGAFRALHELRNWQVEGRIGVRMAEDAWQANLFWEHDVNQDRLRISGPLSQGLVSIIVQKDLVYLNEGHGVTELSHDPELMLRQRLGFSVPLSSLRFWMLGIPNPELDSFPKGDAAASPGAFGQSGWVIHPQQLMRVDAKYDVPQKLLLEGEGVRLKLIIDKWLIRE